MGVVLSFSYLSASPVNFRCPGGLRIRTYKYLVKRMPSLFSKDVTAMASVSFCLCNT